MITFTQFTRFGLLTVLVLLGCTTAHGQLFQDLSDLDPTNPDSGVREGLRDIDESRRSVLGGGIRPDDPTYFPEVSGRKWIWKRMPGLARDIATGADGSIWSVGVNRVPGGFGIWKFNGNNWIPVGGGGESIAIAPDGSPWLVNSQKQIHQLVNGAWKQIPGSANDIAIGAEGSVWIIGTNPVNGGYGLWKWNGVGWVTVQGGGTAIAVTSQGFPLVVNSSKEIYRLTNIRTERLPGSATNIAAGKYNSVYAINTDTTNIGGRIVRLAGSQWDFQNGWGKVIAVDSQGQPWVANASGEIYRGH